MEAGVYFVSFAHSTSSYCCVERTLSSLEIEFIPETLTFEFLSLPNCCKVKFADISAVKMPKVSSKLF